jgi:hypothetical protein
MHSDRNYLAQYLDLIDAQTHEQLGYVCDISDGGLMFATVLPVAIGEIKEVYIQNNLPTDDALKLSIRAVIKTLWSKPNINPQLSCFGCTVLEINAEDYQRLTKLLSHLCFNNDMEIRRTL